MYIVIQEIMMILMLIKLELDINHLLSSSCEMCSVEYNHFSYSFIYVAF